MKFLKFLQIFALVCFFYAFAYTIHALFSMTKSVDYYCVPAAIFLMFTAYWCIIGVTFPQYLPFFKMKSRALVVITSLLAVFALLIVLMLIETHFYKRPALQNIILNGSKVVETARKIDPLGQNFKKSNEM